MLQLNSISLVQFKNYVRHPFRFSERITGICGANGVGKTNLLDAIYYLCFTKSYFARSDAQNVLNGMTGFRIEGEFNLNEQLMKAVCILRDTGRKEFTLNNDSYERFAHHVGKFPCVIIAPDDIRIIAEGSEERRRYIDALISQLDAEYLQRLINYNKILQQRNSCLKSMADDRIRDSSLLDVYDQQLLQDGEYIFTKRQSFLKECTKKVEDFYKKISGNNELVEVRYESQLQNIPFADLLKMVREKDIQLQRTTGGTHKDDLVFLLNGQTFKNVASQGQRKSLLFALKLAEFDVLKEHKSFAPLLLLDDLFEKLDEQRMHNLLDWVCLQNEGQIFITDTHARRISEHLDKLEIAFDIIHL
ncbi:MAG: DNA replication and repair protein RecF [Flavitalea sp.]